MIIKLDEEQQAVILKLAHDTKYATGKVFKHYQAILEANFEQDIADAIADLEEFDNA